MSTSWQQVTIKDIAVVDWGNTNLTKKSFVPDGPYLGVSAAGCDGRMAHAEHKKNTPVLSAIGAQCGRMFLPKEDFTAIKNTITLTPLEGVADPVFLFYLLTFVELPQRGAGQPFISKGDIQKFPVPLPSLEEQKRIVAVLNEAFEGLARARDHAEANLQNAQEIFEQAEVKLFKDVSEGATQTTLGQLATFRNGLNYSRSSQGEEVKVVGVGDFQDNFTIPTDMLAPTKIDGQLGEDDKLVAGDILAVRSNGNRGLIGRTMLMPEPNEPTSFSGFTIRVRLNNTDVLPEYVCSFLRTRAARAKLTAGGGGANISNLNQRILSAFPIYFPDKGRQNETLAQLKFLRDQRNKLANDYTAKIKGIDDLRQSLLQKAFAGELT